MALAPPKVEGLMKILALDTTGWVLSVTLWEDGRELAFLEDSQERNQAATLPQLVQEVLRETKIDHILVNTGPGSFTGIRLGLAFAKGLAMGWGLPLKGIDSFTATYMSLERQEDTLVLIEAHRQDVFAQFFQKKVPAPPQSLTREQIETMLESSSPPLLAGSGVHPFLDGLTFKEVISPWKGAQRLAYTFFKDPSLALDASPFYVREADVSSPKGAPSPIN